MMENLETDSFSQLARFRGLAWSLDFRWFAHCLTSSEFVGLWWTEDATRLVTNVGK
jgi:hypothetical protein